MGDGSAGGTPRVLVIEDNAADRAAYKRTLHAFSLQFADSGEAGLARLAAGEPFDLVVLDYNLPKMNGDEVLARIRGGDPAFAQVPVVVVTGGGSESVAVDLLKKGASDYVTKEELHTPRVASAVRFALERQRLDRDRKRAEEELRLRKDELEAALRQLQRAQAHLIQAEKMASLGQLVAGVTHEINNPLAYAANNLAVLDRDVRKVAGLVALYRAHLGDDLPPALREEEEQLDLDYTLPNLARLLASTRQGLHRVGEIVANLRDFSRLDEGEWKEIDPNEAARVTVAMVGFHARQKGVALDLATGDAPMLWCNPGEINQVLLNLLMNALQAVGTGATIGLSVGASPARDEVIFAVADDGPGIPGSIRGKIFDPFFTTKPQGVGTGLGLWITYNIVADHGGRIELATEPGRGTTFTVTLPLRSPEPPGSA
ncbi:sensor histidine kinase [Tundrisphaera sp. TA3]|uniref:sensor histidine kinase n=1 Tax=Tundrisphaera sp. TA3 TaxID=3435775 RepID=UPI003EC0C5CD